MTERLEILELIESGEVSVGEGLLRLEMLDRGCASTGIGETAEASRQSPSPVTEPACPAMPPAAVAGVWQAVFGIGVAMVAGGGCLLSRAYGLEAMAGLTWGWVLFVLGLLVMGLGWWLRRARWLTLRVREHGGRALALALPLPIELAFWVLRVIALLAPRLHGVDVYEVLLALQEGMQDADSVVIDVDEGPDGDRVEVCIR